MSHAGEKPAGANGPSNTGSEAGRRRPDPRLPAYLVAGFGALIAAIATGRQELVALGAPFLVLAATGLGNRRPPSLRGEVRLQGDRAIEGDLVEGEVWLDWAGPAEVDVMLAGWRGIEPVDPAPALGWSLPLRTGPVTLPFTLRARSWGVHDLGALWVRVRRAGSLTLTEHRLAGVPTLWVLPTPLRISRLLKPAEPRAIAGMHLSHFRGHGTDFAELRPYQPGDRVRDLSWGTSARLGEPWVAVRHPERTGTVLLLLDAFFTPEERSAETLARAARAAWAVASIHLRAQDRVGLLAQGRTTAWLPPQGGRRARWMLLEELLTVGRAAEDLSRRRYPRRRVLVPPDALVAGVTSLRSHIFVPELLRYRRAGCTTVALVIDTSDMFPEARDLAGAAAKRLWIARREVERRALERGGIPTALVTAREGVGASILALRRRLSALENPTRTGSSLR